MDRNRRYAAGCIPHGDGVIVGAKSLVTSKQKLDNYGVYVAYLLNFCITDFQRK